MAKTGAPSLTLPPAARSTTEGRRFVTRALTEWGLDGLVDAAALLTSELITNAVLHARTELTLTVERLPGKVRIEVSDGSPYLPKLRNADIADTTGRGLGLLQMLASSWSVRNTDSGKTVSFTLTPGHDPLAADGR